LVSGNEKLVEPDAAIYQLALRRFGLSNREGMFVDDRPENVEAAERNGFAGHVFADVPILRAALVENGLL
jgi:2-haloacid dehalogenase